MTLLCTEVTGLTKTKLSESE